MRLSDVVEGFLLDRKLTFSANSIYRYRYTLDHFTAFMGDCEIEAVTGNDVRRFLDHLLTEHRLSRRTVSESWAPLSSLWTWAATELEIPNVIRGKVSQPSYTRTVIEPFTESDIRALLKAVEYTKEWVDLPGVRAKRSTRDRDRALILTLLDTGIRISELTALTIADYDQGRARLHIRHGKGDKGRFVVVGSRAQKAIWRMMTKRGKKVKAVSPLFASREGKPLNRSNVAATLKRIGDRAGVSKTHAHRFRHTFAITFLRNGGNLVLLRELLGHESMEMVSHYLRIAECDLDSAVQFSPADSMKL